MAGRPKQREFGRQLAERFGSKDDPTGEDHVFELIADGLTMKEVAKKVGCSSRPMLYNWIKEGGQRRRDKMEAARKASADALVEDGMNILESLARKRTLSQPQVTLGSQRAGYRKWMASVRDREAFGEQKGGVNINVDLGQLHLDALKSAGRMIEEQPAQIEDADYEILPEGEDDTSVPRIAGVDDCERGQAKDDSEGCGDRSPVKPKDNYEPERD